MAPLVHVAVAQVRPRKGDYARDLARFGALLAQVDALRPRPGLVCFPEAALTGYFLEGGVRETAVTAGTLARDLGSAYLASAPGANPLDVVVGFYEVWNNTLYNSAMY